MEVKFSSYVNEQCTATYNKHPNHAQSDINNINCKPFIYKLFHNNIPPIHNNALTLINSFSHGSTTATPHTTHQPTHKPTTIIQLHSPTCIPSHEMEITKKN